MRYSTKASTPPNPCMECGEQCRQPKRFCSDSHKDLWLSGPGMTINHRGAAQVREARQRLGITLNRSTGGVNSVSNVLSKPSLYDLSLEGVQIADLLTEREGELTPEIEQRIDALMMAGPERVEAAAIVVRQLEANADACAGEMERLAARAASFHANAQHLKERIAIVLDCAFNGKLKTEKFTAWTQQSADHTGFAVREGHTIEEVEAADPSLVRVKKELDKIALKKKFDRAEALPLAIHFETTAGKRFLRLK